MLKWLFAVLLVISFLRDTRQENEGETTNSLANIEKYNENIADTIVLKTRQSKKKNKKNKKKKKKGNNVKQARRRKKQKKKEDQLCLSSHNTLRALHQNTPQLKWVTRLQKEAQRYANELVKINNPKKTKDLILEHEETGENLYWSDSRDVRTCVDASLAWYEEMYFYDYTTTKSTDSRIQVGHFTQLVWKNTFEFGVGVATMKSRNFPRNTETFIVAKYKTPGNIRGRFKENVKLRKNGAVTPSLEDLDPSRKPKCEDLTSSCDAWIDSGEYVCKGDEFEEYFKYNCYKKCKYC